MVFNRLVGPVPDWPKVFADWEDSGQSQRDFCSQRGYSYSRFKDARVKHGFTRARRFSKKAAAKSKSKISTPRQTGFFAVNLDSQQRTTAPTKKVEPAEQSEIELRLPFGVVLTFRGVSHK